MTEHDRGLCRSLGRAGRLRPGATPARHGAYIDEVSIAFAKQLQAEAEQYAASLLGEASGARWPSSRRSWVSPGQ